jgi:hypothetical protein
LTLTRHAFPIEIAQLSYSMEGGSTMVRLRLSGPICLALALVLIAARPVRADEPKPPKVVSTHRAGVSAEPENCTCVVYSLDEFGADADLGGWLAETVPEMVAPGTWKGPGSLRYYAPKNILVVYHSPAVQAQVDGFLKKVTQATTAKKEHGAAVGKTSMPGRSVVPAAYHAPAEFKPSPVPEPSAAYPVPAPVRAPKHLFHFIIRYEGEGIVDDSVVQALKAYSRTDQKEAEANSTCSTPTCCPVAPPTGPASLVSPVTPSGLPSLEPDEPAEKAPKPKGSKKGSKTS